MFKKWFVVDEKLVGASETYEEIKKIEEISQNNLYYKENLEMKCENIMNQGVLEFIMEMSSLLLAFAVFFVSLFGDDVGIANPIQAFFIFVVAVIIIGVWGIGLHRRKCKAQDILFVLRRMNES